MLYGTIEEAVAKIVRVMTNPDEQASLCDYLDSRKGLFSTEQFICRIREIVRQFSTQ